MGPSDARTCYASPLLFFFVLPWLLPLAAAEKVHATAAGGEALCSYILCHLGLQGRGEQQAAAKTARDSLQLSSLPSLVQWVQHLVQGCFLE